MTTTKLVSVLGQEMTEYCDDELLKALADRDRWREMAEKIKDALEAVCLTVEKDYPFIRDIQSEVLKEYEKMGEKCT